MKKPLYPKRAAASVKESVIPEAVVATEAPISELISSPDVKVRRAVAYRLSELSEEQSLLLQEDPEPMVHLVARRLAFETCRPLGRGGANYAAIAFTRWQESKWWAARKTQIRTAAGRPWNYVPDLDESPLLGDSWVGLK